MKFKEFLNEKTYNTGNDVEYIYKKTFKPFMDAAKKNDFKFLEKYADVVFMNPYPIDSKELKSKISKQAHSLNPIKIQFGGSDSGFSAYASTAFKNRNSHDDNHIKLNIKPSAIQAHIDGRFNIYNPIDAKRVIAHELTHWIRHSVDEFNPNRKNPTTNLEYFLNNDEIDALIHEFVYLKKRGFKKFKKWDEVTWDILFKENVQLRNTILTLKKEPNNIKQKWFEDFTKRLNREGLLNKYLIKFPKQLR